MENFIEDTSLFKRASYIKSGATFNLLTVVTVGWVDDVKGVLCSCECGGEILVKAPSKLQSGHTKSCGKCTLLRDRKDYLSFLEQYKHKLEEAGIIHVSFDHWKNNKIPYWCNVHRESSTKSRASLRKFTVAPCFKCGKLEAAKKRTKSTEQFIKDANLVWNNFWDYSKTVYTGSHEELTITCKEHGDFTQTATDHLSGYCSCKGCSPTSGFDKNKSGNFYIVKWYSGNKDFLKIGITNKDVSYRVSKQKTRRSGIIFEPMVKDIYHFPSGKDCSSLENEVNREFKGSVVTKEEFPDGFTETIDSENYSKLKTFIENYLNLERIQYEKL